MAPYQAESVRSRWNSFSSFANNSAMAVEAEATQAGMLAEAMQVEMQAVARTRAVATRAGTRVEATLAEAMQVEQRTGNGGKEGQLWI
jgi:hypothetical protein